MQSKYRVLTLRVIILLASVSVLNGCFATKIITVPMRVGGAVLSVVPVVGNIADDTIDVVADTVDLLPL